MIRTLSQPRSEVYLVRGHAWSRTAYPFLVKRYPLRNECTTTSSEMRHCTWVSVSSVDIYFVQLVLQRCRNNNRAQNLLLLSQVLLLRQSYHDIP